jgi:hypothetical protein
VIASSPITATFLVRRSQWQRVCHSGVNRRRSFPSCLTGIAKSYDSFSYNPIKISWTVCADDVAKCRLPRTLLASEHLWRNHS